MSMNDSLVVQFEKILQPRLKRVNDAVGTQVADLFIDRMKSNALSGKGFGNDQFDSTYHSRSHRAARKKQGLQTSRVTLGMKQRRIENTQVTTTGGSKGETVITHAEMGDVFKMHHTGTAAGNYMRSIWPKSVESIPESLKNRVKETVSEVLRGEK